MSLQIEAVVTQLRFIQLKMQFLDRQFDCFQRPNSFRLFAPFCIYQDRNSQLVDLNGYL